MNIRIASGKDSEIVGAFEFDLMSELSGPKPLNTSRAEILETSRKLLAGPGVWAFLAETSEGEPAGVLTLNACAAIYAGGHFGEISELYVRPEYRSTSVGKKLIEAAVEFGKRQAWTRLEVCA